MAKRMGEASNAPHAAGSALPTEMQAARNRLVVEIQAVIGFMGRNDIAQANQHLQTIEDTLTEIEKYLGR